MNSVMNMEKNVKHKWWIVTYLAVIVALIIISFIPMGYSFKDKKAETVSFTDHEVGNKRVNSRTYTESYKVSATENIQINNILLSYSAADPDFKGVIEASISDESSVISSKSVNITSTSAENQYSTVYFSFNEKVSDIEVQFLKGHEYILSLKINTNIPDYHIKEFGIFDQQIFHFETGTDKSIMSGIEYVSIEKVRYGELFFALIILMILINGLFLLNKLGFAPAVRVAVKRTIEFIQKYCSEIILLVIFVYLALYEFYFGYVGGTYISQDSVMYLTEADAVQHGYGFNYLGRSGYYQWFAGFPIGYPLLIAIVSSITGRNVYLASKILAVLIIWVFLLLLYVKFRKKAWIYSFCLFNTGFLEIYKYTWSEIPFILGLLVFCLILDHIVEHDKIKFRWYLFWGLSSAWLFLCRYFGAFSIMVIGLVWAGYIGIFFFKEKRKDPAVKRKVIGCTVSGLISGIVSGSYFLLNYINAGTMSGNRSMWWDEYSVLTDNFYSALVTEVSNASRMVWPEPITSMSWNLKAWIIVLFIAVIIYLFYKYRPKDFRVVFIGVGIFYYVIFSIIRYQSSMDLFSYRFFAPASILLTIGLLGFFVPFLERNKNKIAPVALCILVISVLGICEKFETFDRYDTEFSKLSTELQNALYDVPDHSTILGAGEIDYRARIFRPDINYVVGTIGVDDTMDALFERYSKSDYICIKAKYIKDILFCPVYDYDRSVIDFFDGITREMSDEKLLVISVRQRKLL